MARSGSDDRHSSVGGAGGPHGGTGRLHGGTGGLPGGLPAAAPAGTLLERVAARLAGDPRSGTFVRGLTAGALVGAAIAGSTIWSRLRRPAGR